MTSKKLSRRPLKRSIVFEVQCGPYSAFRDGKDRPRQSYVIWTANLPRGAKSQRFVACLQQITRPGQLGDQVHNPVLYQRIALLPKRPKLAAKQKMTECLNMARHQLYWLLDKHLKHAVRPMLRARNQSEEWQNFEPGNAESTLGQWRYQTMAALGKHLGDWAHPYEPWTY